MFAQLCTLAFLLPYVAASIVLSVPSTINVGDTVTVTWTAASNDPTSFTLELGNPAYHNTFAVGNNLQTANGQVTFQLPEVLPGSGYTFQAIDPSNINTIYYQSPSFSIGAQTTASTTAASTTSTSASTLSMSTSSFTGTSTTTPVSSAKVSSASAAGTSSAASSTPTTFNSSGAASFKLVGMAPAAALVLSAVAGAVMVF